MVRRFLSLVVAASATATVSHSSGAAVTPQVCVVIKTYAAHQHSLPVTLAGIFSDAHTRDHMRAVVVETDTESPFPGLRDLVSRMNSLIGFDGILISPRTSENVRVGFPKLKMNDYGYLASDAALDDLLFAWATARWASEAAGNSGACSVASDGPVTSCGDRQMRHVVPPLPYAAEAGLTCDLLLVTNGDNVYAMDFWSQVLQALSPWRPPTGPVQLAVDAGPAPDPGPQQPPVRPGGAHLVATHWATHYEQPEHSKSYAQLLSKAPHCGPVRGGIFSEVIASTEFIPGCVDLGAVAFRADLIARSGLRFYADLLKVCGFENERVAAAVTLRMPTLQEHPTGERIKVPSARARCEPNAAYCADGHFAHRAWQWTQANVGVGSSVVVRMPLMLHR